MAEAASGMRRRVVAMAMACLLLPASAFAAPSLSGVRFGQHPDKTRVVLDVTDKVGFHASVFPDPWRMVVDFDKSELPRLPDALAGKGQGLVKRYFSTEKGDVVFETGRAVQIVSSFSLPSGEGKPPRIVIDIASPPAASASASVPDPAADAEKLEVLVGALVAKQPAPAKADTLQPAEARAEKPSPPASGKQVLPTPLQPRKLVVIDPGHGGQDPGAVGADGSYEKDITLAIARELEKQIGKDGKCRVLLTRNNDRSLRLSDRVRIARDSGADLFISLHADSIGTDGVAGASVYTLSEKASDSETAKLAARENRADIIAGLDLSDEGGDVAGILIDLAMRETQNQSHLLSAQMVREMEAADISLLEKPRRSAGFAVLKAPDTPSLLVEMGYLSSGKEVKLLQSSVHQRRIAGALLKGIDSYFSWLEGVSGI